MKLTLFVMVLSIAQVFAKSSYSQSNRLSLNLKNTSIRAVLNQIEEESEYYFIYDASKVDVDKKVSIETKQKHVSEVLDELFEDSKIIYRINDRQIAISTTTSVNSANQSKDVSGNVTDTSGEPLPGVSIIIKGTTTGTITDFDGNFTIANVPDDAMLVFSFVGMKPLEVTVSGKTVFNILMEEDAIGIEEVVAVGYGSQRKINLTGSISSVSAEEFIATKPITNISEGLQGAIPGLNISFESGEPGNRETSFNVRGGMSITDGAGPLVLVDGVTMSLDLINPEDIESVTVLKDAASAAIYGARAAFGVVLVTTKKGKSGEKLQISYNSKYMFNQAMGIPKVSDLRTWFATGTTAWSERGSTFFINKDWIAAYNVADGTDQPEVVKSPDDRNWYMRSSDLQDAMIRDNSFSHSQSISVSGGTDKLSYYGSLGYLDQNGMYKVSNDKYERYNVVMDVNSKLTDWLSLGSKVSYNKVFNDKPHAYTNYFSASYTAYPFSRTEPFPESGLQEDNAYSLLKLAPRRKIEKNDFWVTLRPKIQINDNWRVIGEWTYNDFSSVDKDHQKVLTLGHTWRYNTTVYAGRPNYVSMRSDFESYNVINAYTEYEKKFSDHFVKAMVGYNQEEKKYQWHSSQRNDLISNDLAQLNLATGDQYVNGRQGHWSIRGVFYRLNYVFKDKYLLELNGRYDGTSRFPDDDRFGFFPSASAGWRVSEEGFMESTKDIITNLKLRASYGQLGNQQVPNYAYIPSMGTSKPNWIVGSEKPLTVDPSGLVSNTLTWEKSATANIGVDLTLINKLEINFDAYTRTTEDMLMSVELPALLGTSPPKQNAANLKTYGWELSLGWNDSFANNEVKYGLSLGVADNQTEITDYDNPTGYLGDYYEGRKFGEIWGYETDRFFTSVDDVANSPSQTKITSFPLQAGDIKYKDLNDDKEISLGDYTLDDHGDMKIIGNSTARYSFNLNGNVQWKNFDMSFVFQGIGKRDVWLSGSLMAPFTHMYSPVYDHQLDYWTEDNTGAYWARLVGNSPWNYKTQTKYLQDASYIRLKNVHIGYTLPKSVIQRIGLSKVKVFVSGQNLWTKTGLKVPFDPEGTLNGGKVYPFQRTYAFGINVTL